MNEQFGDLQLVEGQEVAALRDPVCGMSVTPDSQYHFVRGDEMYYFCSSRCLDKFSETSDLYLESGALEHSPVVRQDTGVYTCPMDPEVRQKGPGACPKCGMALEPPIALASKTRYTCPMHPEIVRDDPGECPRCGMALEPMASNLDDDEFEKGVR